MPAVCLLEARLEASDVGFLVREAHPCGGGLVWGGQVGVPKRRPPSSRRPSSGLQRTSCRGKRWGGVAAVLRSGVRYDGQHVRVVA